ALVHDAGSPTVVVARFLALLELYREGAVAFDQVTPLGELTIRWTGGDAEVTVEDDYDAEPADAPAPEGGERGARRRERRTTARPRRRRWTSWRSTWPTCRAARRRRSRRSSWWPTSRCRPCSSRRSSACPPRRWRRCCTGSRPSTAARTAAGRAASSC